jgi:hypothetical protein
LPASEEYADTILVGTKKWRPEVNWDFLKHLPTAAVLVTDNQEELDRWPGAPRDLPTRVLPSLYELYRAIHSCKLFIGGLSSPLAAAMAAHRPCVYLRSHAIDLDVHNVCVEKLPWSHFRIVDAEPVRAIETLLETVRA